MPQRNLALSALAAMALIFIPTNVPAETNFEGKTAHALYELLRQYRIENGRQPLTTNSTLERVAQAFAALMARKRRLDHFADGSDPGERMRRAGYKWCAFSENIARSTAVTPALRMGNRFMQIWRKSPGHKANMLKDSIRDVGIAIESDGAGRYYAAQVFGRPGC